MAELYSFGRFVMDTETERLYADGVLLPVGSTDLRLLAALVERAGTHVSKAELIARVWRNAAVTDNAIYVHVNALRRVIGDECITTKQNRGYRFVQPVQRTLSTTVANLEKPQQGNLDAIWSDNQPQGAARLVGRSNELKALSKLLVHNQVVTLTGPGGVGKTKLAMHIAGRAASRFPDGVWVIELANLNDPDLIFVTVAAALSIEVGSSTKPLETIGRNLSRKSLLIVLDNCEHMVISVAQLCNALSNAAPGVKILATSQQPIGFSGEKTCEVLPLALPSDEEPSLDLLRKNASIELFVERARNTNANFLLRDEDVRIAANICRHLDGLPLAIEMVASWAGLIGLEALVGKLDGSFRGWLRTTNTAGARHSTLSATLEWSYHLLAPLEQRALHRLSVLAGSFSLEAAEAIVSDADMPASDVLDVIVSLIRKSLVAIVPGAQTHRYRLLETTRLFMAEKLRSSAEFETIQQKHAQYVLNVLKRARNEWERTSDADWQSRYAPIIDDLRAALEWSMLKRPADAIQLAGMSWPLWREFSLRVEGRQWLSQARHNLGADVSSSDKAQLLRGLGDLSMNSVDMEAAEIALTEAALLYRRSNDSIPLGSALTPLAFLYLNSGRVSEAKQTIDEALQLLDPEKHARTLATAYSVKMCIDSRLGRSDASQAAGNTAMRLCEMIGADRQAFMIGANLIEISLDEDAIDNAIAAGRALATKLRSARHSYVRGFVLGLLSAALTVRGDLDEALAVAREAAPLLRDQRELFWLFDQLALRSALAGLLTDAALLAGYAEAIRKENSHPRWPIAQRASDRLDQLLKCGLPDEEVQRLKGVGARLSEDQAVVLALGM